MRKEKMDEYSKEIKRLEKEMLKHSPNSDEYKALAAELKNRKRSHKYAVRNRIKHQARKMRRGQKWEDASK